MKEKKHILFKQPLKPLLDYHRHYLWDFLENFRKFEGIPETVDLRFFCDKLITDGYAPVVEYPGKGLLCLDGAISGLDWYYRPRVFTSTNAILKSIKREISYIDNLKPNGAVVCFNTHDYRSPQPMTDLVEVYAYKLAQADVSTIVSLENSRATLVPAVSDKESAQRVTDSLRDIYDGKPATIAYKSSFSGQPDFQLIPIKARDNLITADLTDTKRQIMSEFLTRLGINVTPIDKKERVNVTEATSNKQELEINAKIYLEPCERFCRELNATYGLNASVSIEAKMVENMLGGVSNESERVYDDNPESRA